MRTYDDIWREHHPLCLVYLDNYDESMELWYKGELARVECTCEEHAIEAYDREMESRVDRERGK
jgi:hypothetical protein